MDFSEIASKTPNFTGADLKALLYNAQLLQVKRTLDRRERAASGQTEDEEQQTVALFSQKNREKNSLQPPSSVGNQQHFESDKGQSRTQSIRKTSNILCFNYNQLTVDVERTVQSDTTVSRIIVLLNILSVTVITGVIAVFIL